MIILTDIVNNQLFTRKYIGYTFKQAEKLFKQEIKQAVK